MNTNLPPLASLLDNDAGPAMPLGAELLKLYGPLHFGLPEARPWVISNFVSTLDGVTALEDPALAGGAEISGHSAVDRMVMGLLRSVASAIVVGAGTLRLEPRAVWTPGQIYPGLTPQYADVRRILGLAAAPLTVVVTARGSLDMKTRVFVSGEAPVLIVTTVAGEQRLRQQVVPPSVQIVAAGNGAGVTAAAVLAAVEKVAPGRIVLVEGGPHLMSDFFAEGKMDELFLTLAPQVAGRVDQVDRPGFVAGRLFIPGQPCWGRLLSVKSAQSHLFLRYGFSG